MFDAMRHDDEFAFADDRLAIAEFHPQRAFDHQKHFVLTVVVMPDKFAFELYRLHIEIIELTDDFWVPAVGEAIELFRKVDRVHDPPLLLFTDPLKTVSGFRYGIKNAPRRFRLAGLGVNPQHVFCARRAHHYPARFAEIKFDAVHVFATRHRKIEEAIQLAVRKMRDGFFLLPWLQLKVHAAIMVFAKLRVQRRQQFAKRFPMPGHQLRQKESRDRGVALGKIQTRTDAAALFAANQNVLLQHQLANVFEADRHFVELAPEFRRQLVDELRHREGFSDVARKIPRPSQVPDEQRQNLVRIDESAGAVNCADAVAIPVGAKARIVFAGQHGLPQRFDVWLDGLRMHAAEARIPRSANFVAQDAIAAKQLRQQTGSGSVHRIENKPQLRPAQPLPVHKFFKRIQVRRAGLEGLY